MPSTRVPLALVAVLVLAGCAELPGSAGTNGEDPGSTTVPAAEVVDYRDLPTETQRAFRIAIEDGSVVRDADAFDGFSREEDGYVRYEGAIYATAIEPAGVRAEYAIYLRDSADRTPATSEEDVVHYSNFSDTERRVFDRVRREGRSRQYGPDEFPDSLREHAYVEHQGRLYPIGIEIADVPQWELRVEEVDAGPEE